MPKGSRRISPKEGPFIPKGFNQKFPENGLIMPSGSRKWSTRKVCLSLKQLLEIVYKNCKFITKQTVRTAGKNGLYDKNGS